MAEINPFFQSLEINGLNAGVSNFIEGTYIERMNLTCPKLILKLEDKDKLYQDNGKLVAGARLTLRLGDIDSRGQALFKESFIVGSCSSDGPILNVEALQEDIYRIKQPLSIPHFFVNKSIIEIISFIFPNYKIEHDNFVEKVTYHCLTNSTYSMMLEQLSSDFGAAIWLNRGVVHIKKLNAVMAQDEAFKMDFNQNLSKNNTIRKYDSYHKEKSKLRLLSKDFFSWTIQNGVKQLSSNKPRVFLSNRSESQLHNNNLFLINITESLLAGNGDFTCGKTVKLMLTRFSQESVLDESVPGKQIMLGVRHYQKRNAYLCACELGNVVDGNQ